ncbi:MAG: FecR domain-containing protein [Mariniphaga sp.]
MNLTNDQIYSLIAKSFSGELTDEELILLNSWKKSDKANLSEYTDYVDIWNHSKRLAMPSKIDLAGSLNTTRRKAGLEKSQVRWLRVFSQIAAILVLAVLFSVLYNQFLAPKTQQRTEQLSYQQVKASYGMQSRVELADGSIVYLNSGSTLRFPTSFNGMKSRKVELTGEGHFSVTKNKEQPFIVDIHKLEIKVLGTTFNVDAYPSNATFTIALIEGSIRLEQNSGNGIKELMELKPNQIATYQPSENLLTSKTENDLSKYTAWTEGKIVFSNDPVNIVTQKLGNWYNVDIVAADIKLNKYRFTGTFIDEPLEQVLNILNLTSKMEYKVIPARKLADNSYSKRKIILKSR